MKRLLFLLALFTSIIHAQEENTTELDLITDTHSAEAFIKANKSKGNKLITFNEENHKSVLATNLFKLPLGGKTTTENNFEKTTYKVVEKNTVTHYRLSYILLDSQQMEASKTKAYRDRIIASYHNGSPFDFLAKKYSVADNATRGGDTGWFKKDDISLFFDVDVIENNHTKHEIYTMDNEEKGLYYIVLNTHQPKEIKEIKVLKIVEQKN
ncbi:MAG: peptidylprolyl isomerase [Xanthomarina gelatinilytica]|uniref:peptidylprolyl isomerase n=1 Tax=Xanthomarina gelatinilytica TaxID=1137281 RepID=UPI003A87A0A7